MVQTLRLQRGIHRTANSRNDCWGRAVAGQINSIIDLPAADVRYHHSCNSNFRTGKDISYKYSNNKKRKSCRSVVEKKQDAFHQVFFFIIMLDT